MEKRTKKKSSIIKFSLVGFFLIIGLLLSFVTITFPNYATFESFASNIKLGLDLQGGVYAVYEISDSDAMETEDLASSMSATRTRLEELLYSKGYTEATVVLEGTTRLRVEVPDVDDPEDIFILIGQPCTLEFIDASGVTILTGENVESASSGYDSSTAGYAVYLELDSVGSAAFSEATSSSHTGETISIVTTVNGESTTISSPTINDQITNGSAIITGMEDSQAASDLADQITAGQFDVELSLLECSTITATLGEDALLRGIIACIVGIAIVMIFMCVIYRGLGFIASFALLIYVTLMIIFLALLPWVQLSLPGIAGILLSVGMAVDGNVIIFERIKGEYRSGKSIMASAYAGRRKALSAIVDSNITTIIAAIVLIVFGTSTVQSFAITLLLGIVLALFSNLVLLRVFTNWALGINSSDETIYNLKRGSNYVEYTPDDPNGGRKIFTADDYLFISEPTVEETAEVVNTSENAETQNVATAEVVDVQAVEEVALQEVAIEEVVAEEVTAEEVVMEEVAIEEVAPQEVVVEEVTAEEVVVEEVTTEEVVMEEAAPQDEEEGGSNNA